MSKLQKLDVAILNYNNASDTVNLSNDLLEQIGVSLRITIVDNCSTDESYRVLTETLIHEKVTIIKSSFNGGYAYGNNFGLKHIDDEANKYVAIVNPDAKIADNFLFSKLIDRFENLRTPGFIAPASIDSDGEINSYCAKRVPSYLHEIISCFIVFSKFIARINSYNLNDSVERDMHVEMLSGSFLLTKFDFFREIGFFDEGTFLFCEERILSKRTSIAGAKNYLICDINFKHFASTTIGSLYSTVGQVKLLHESLLFYIKNYLPNGELKAAVIWPLLKFKIFQLNFLQFFKAKVMCRLKKIQL